MPSPRPRPEPDPLRRRCAVCGGAEADRWGAVDEWIERGDELVCVGPSYAHTSCDPEQHWFRLTDEDLSPG